MTVFIVTNLQGSGSIKVFSDFATAKAVAEADARIEGGYWTERNDVWNPGGPKLQAYGANGKYGFATETSIIERPVFSDCSQPLGESNADE